MAKSNATPETPEEISSESTPTQRVKAVCPTNNKHGGAVVYSTKGRTRYCKCNDCGTFWKQTGSVTSPVSEKLLEIADKLDESAKDPQRFGEADYVVFSVPSAQRLAKTLRGLADQAVTGAS